VIVAAQHTTVSAHPLWQVQPVVPACCVAAWLESATQGIERSGPRARRGPGTLELAVCHAGRAMEADQLNQIENSLQDLAARSAELRRYL
jgi:hypothetical protein